MLKLLREITGILLSPLGNKAAGLVNGGLSIGAVAGAVSWLLGPGRDWSITLNALELSGLVLLGCCVGEWSRRSFPLH